MMVVVNGATHVASAATCATESALRASYISPGSSGSEDRRFQAGHERPADFIVSDDIVPSRQGPAPDMSSASAPPTLTALETQRSHLDTQRLKRQ